MTSPTNPGDPDIVGLVRSLTKTELGAIRHASPLMHGGKLLYLAAYRDGGRLHEQLVQAKLATRTFNGVRLSPLGLRVRAYLLDNPS